MNANDALFHAAAMKLIREVFDGPPGSEAYILNPGDPGLLRQLDGLDAAAASSRPDAWSHNDRKPCEPFALRSDSAQPLGVW